MVIYSMTSSSAEDAPRGMSFLYNPNRKLLEPECSTPEQMRWADGSCRYRELATEVVI